MKPKTVKRVLPGYGLSRGVTLAGISFFVLLPIAALILRGVSISPSEFAAAAFSPRALKAYQLTFTTALGAALANAAVGLLLGWTLTRYTFPGRGFFDGLIDLPFALPTAVAGITLTTLYSRHGWFGSILVKLGVEVAFTSVGITLAMFFVGLPFVVRAVQPVLESMDRSVEEAARSLGAGSAMTFLRVIFPTLLPALLLGFTLAFARGLGEYGSVIFIAGNMPYRTEVASLLIVTQLEEFDYAGATSISLVMIGVSLLLLLGLNKVQSLVVSRRGGA